MCKGLAFSVKFDKIVRKVRLYCLLSIYKIYFIEALPNGKKKDTIVVNHNANIGTYRHVDHGKLL